MSQTKTNLLNNIADHNQRVSEIFINNINEIIKDNQEGLISYKELFDKCITEAKCGQEDLINLKK